MNGKFALALLLNLALLSLVATCTDPFVEVGPMGMDPMMTMPGIAPFPENELNDLMLDMRDVPAPENNHSIASLATPGIPVPVRDWSCPFGGNFLGGSLPDYAESVQETLDGGYVIAGTTFAYMGGGWNIWLIKIDKFGTKLWDKEFNTDASEYGRSVQETREGGYVIAGNTNKYDGFSDVWLIKTDSAGTKVWDKTFGGTSYDYAESVQETSDGGYVIAGTSTSYGAGWADVWLIKTDSSGNKLWDKTFGGTNNDDGYSAQETNDGGYVIAGTSTSYGAGESDIWLIKTDSFGNEMWNKTFGGTGSDVGYSVQQTSDGGYVIAGTSTSYGAGSIDVWLVKTDSAGNKLWDKTFGGTSDDYAESVQETSDDGYVIAGYTTSYGAGSIDVWLVKTDSAGNKVWDKTFGGTSDDRGYSVQETSDGGYVIAGYTTSYGAGNKDAWLIKTEPLPTLYYPDFTDTNDPNSWRSWFVIQNPTTKTANVYIVLKNRAGAVLYRGGSTIHAGGVGAIRPRTLVGSDCAGSAVVTSDVPLKATCQITRNSNEMCMSYAAIGSE